MFKDLSKTEKRTLLGWGVLAIVVFIIALILRGVIVIPGTKPKEEIVKEEVYSIERDRNRYYTVSSALTKYYAFINAKSYENVLHILDSKYVEERNITVDNITSFVGKYDKAITFESGIMCSKKISKSVQSYVVNVSEKSMNSGKFIGYKYYEIILDGKQFHFSVKPISEEDYRGVCDE